MNDGEGELDFYPDKGWRKMMALEKIARFVEFTFADQQKSNDL